MRNLIVCVTNMTAPVGVGKGMQEQDMNAYFFEMTGKRRAGWWNRIEPTSFIAISCIKLAIIGTNFKNHPLIKIIDQLDVEYYYQCIFIICLTAVPADAAVE
jgi:hypothetical protein